MKKSILVASLLGASCGQMYGAGAPAQPPPGNAGGGPPGGGPPGGDPWQRGERGEDPPTTGDPWASSATPDPAPAPTPPAPAGRAAPAATAPPLAQQLLDAHNRYRARHCASPLTWSPELAAFAQRWADTLRDRDCAFEHSRGKYGENLAGGTSGALDAEAVVAMWYDEIKGYSFQQPGFSMQTGHFTQVVWKGSTKLGCARSRCEAKNMDLWVCEYDPPGNWEGRFREHVLPACK